MEIYRTGGSWNDIFTLSAIAYTYGHIARRQDYETGFRLCWR